MTNGVSPLFAEMRDIHNGYSFIHSVKEKGKANEQMNRNKSRSQANGNAKANATRSICN